MDTWILRFSVPRKKPSDPRKLAVHLRDANGDVTEIASVDIEGRNANLPGVVEAQVKEGRVRLVLDLVTEKQLDSNDLAQLIGAAKYAADAGGQLVFANPNSRIREVLRITHLDEAMPIFDSIGAASEHFSTSR